MRPLVLLASFAALLSAADFRTGVYQGRVVQFENIAGIAVYQGDILLGDTAAIEVPRGADGAALKTKASSITSSAARLWPGGNIPYTIDATLSSSLQQRINDAIAHWNTKTLIKLAPRATGNNAENNYVRFTTSTSTVACSSSVGMIGGQQLIRLPDACGLGPIIHEIGHAVGFWHEQERADRNQYLTILYTNIDKNYASNYDQVFSSGRDFGPYNFNSIMHYGAFDFSSDGILPAMETVPAGIPIGQRTGLAPGDLDTLQRMYGAAPTKTTITTTPSGLKILVDGVLVDDGTAFDWAPGSTHRLEAPFQGDTLTRFLFGSWSDNGALAHTITASANTTVYIANYIRQRHISFAASPIGGGSIQALPSNADGFYTERSNVLLTATPANGFSFVNWNLTPSRSLNPRYHTVNATTAVSAAFSAGVVTTVTSDPIGRTVIVDGSTYTTPVNFVWTSGTSHTLDVDTTQPDFIHYNFNNWDDGAPQRRTVTAASRPTTLTAKFTTQYQLTLSFSSSSGTVTANPSSADGYYDAGTTVQLTATPRAGLLLSSWTGDLGGTTNPATVVMNGEKLIGATFATSLPAITAVSAASGLTGAVAPGEIVVIYGSGLGPASLTGLQVSAGKVTNTLAGTQVFFDSTPAPMIYTSANQVSAVVPYGVNGRTLLLVSYNGRTTSPVSLTVADTAPGLFTYDSSGKGGAAALNQNGGVNTPSNPARRGEIIVLYVTGEGATTPAGVDGQVANVSYPKPVAPISVRIGGLPAVVHYAGAAPTFVSGVMQINAQIPDGIRTGPDVPVQIVAGVNSSSPEVTIAVQ